MTNDKQDIILFDLDGTLIDSTDSILEAFYFTFEFFDFDFKHDVDFIKNQIGYPLEIMYENLGVQTDKIDMFVDKYKLKYREISQEKTTLLPQAKEAIELAKTFARVAVVTTKTIKYTIPLLKYLGINDYFEVMIGRTDVQNPKPHPEPIYKALKLMNIDINKDKDNCFMIGDTKLDLIAANSAGIQSYGVLTGYGKKEELSQYSNNIVTNTFEAINKIKNRYK